MKFPEAPPVVSGVVCALLVAGLAEAGLAEEDVAALAHLQTSLLLSPFQPGVE